VKRKVILSLILVFLLSACLATAQETRGAIVGRVSDPTGAVIPGASVVVTNTAMGTKVSATTGADGFYQALFLQPGLYKMEVTAQGFKKLEREAIEVRLADRLEINLPLEVGSTEESVTVTAEAPLMNTETASVGTLVDSRRVMTLPLSYGNPFLMTGLASGVAFVGDPRLDRPFEPTHIVNYAMSGTRGDQSDITIDGGPTTAKSGSNVIAAYVPPTDAVAEFKVQTSTFDASFGQTLGGVTNMIVKSGTNTMHGTAFFSFYRPTMWANDFFNNKKGGVRPPFTYNRWGGSVGGPVWLGKLYNGKNKTFFFYAYEGIHDRRPRYDGTANTVPSPAMLTGDFSSLLAIPGTGPSYQIYDPGTRVAVAGGRIQETPFAGNIVPISRFNAVAKNIIKIYPAPTSAPNADGTANLLEPNLDEPLKFRNHLWRIDENLSERHRFFVRASIYDRNSEYDNYFNNIGTGVHFAFPARAAVFDDVYTLSPTTILNTRYSYSRYIRYQDQLPAAWGFDLTSLGFPASYANAIAPGDRRYPIINLGGPYIATGYNSNGTYQPDMIHTIGATLTKVVGTHAIRTGAELRFYQETTMTFGGPETGQFNFDSTFTRGPLDNSATSPSSIGQSVAALELGLASSSSAVTRAASFAEQSNSWGFFVQDDWKVSPRLTVNLGLRYEFEQPLHERWNRSIVNFDSSYVQPFSATAAANYAKNDASLISQIASISAKGGLTFAGVNGNNGNLYNTPKNGFLPRAGLSWQFAHSTVMRAGVGMFQGFLGVRRNNVNQAGFSQNTNMVPTIDNITFAATLSNPYPNGITEPIGAAGGPQTYLGQGISYFNQNPKVPRVFRWEYGLQRELPGGFMVQADYVGTKTYRLEVSRNLDALPNQYLSTSPFRDNTTNSYLTATVPNPFYNLVPGNSQTIFSASTIARTALMVPYPEFSGVTTTTNEGYSWYHSLQLGAQKRFSKGYTIMVNYTISKFMQATNLLNAGDPAPVREISDQDVPRRLTMSGIAQLPFGPGKLVNVQNPVLSRIVGGWEISGIYTLQMGFPIGWGNIICLDPSQILLPKDQRTTDHYFNTAPFDKVSANQLVSNVRTFPLRFPQIRQPDTNNVDLSLIKNTRIKEGKDIQFRFEALNAFNHPLLSSSAYGNVQTSVTSATFGQIIGSNQAGYPRRLQITFKYVF
jgi:hypothetical protein